jgi:uncharacterized protein
MIVAFIAVLITAGSLSAQPAASLPPLPADLDIRTLTIRAAKDSVLRHGADSPLLATDRDDFGGLAYYTLEPKHRLIGELYRFGQPRQIHLPTNADETISMERFGRLKWQWQGKDFWFEVYRNPSVETLEVFFKDTTNGDQTYSGGRYVPLTALGDGYYLLDFNMAYNPYCAYNPEYICPMPPPENLLPFAVASGEKNYPKASY